MHGHWIDRRWRPHGNFSDILQIDFQSLYDAGYRLVLLDIDNTLVPHGTKEPDARARQVIARLEGAHLTATVVSNARSRRSRHFCDLLAVPCLPYAAKPSPRGVLKACKMQGVEPARTVLIGDQLFTDVAAARAAGASAIRVAPITRNEPCHIRLKRLCEKTLQRRFALQTQYVDLPQPDRHR